jgi:hypothetical protein
VTGFIKLMIVARRAPGMSRSAAHKHLRDTHGPMVVCAPANAGPMPSGYVQNHVFDGAYPAGEARRMIERDIVTELWFDTIDHMRASVTTPYYLTNLKPDEPCFVDDPTVERLVVDEAIVRDGPRGPDKLFVFASKADRKDAFACLQNATAIVDNTALPSPFGPPFSECVLEAWFPDQGATVAALDAAPALALAAREWSTAALRSLHARK